MSGTGFDEIVLGNEYRDTITGFTGIATSRSEFINGCVQAYLEAKSEKKNEEAKGLWVDVDRLEMLGKGVNAALRRTGGGHRPHPST